MDNLNRMCSNCLKLGKGCNGTTCQTWTGCVYRVTILDEMKRQAAEINRQKAEAIKTGKNLIAYTNQQFPTPWNMGGSEDGNVAYQQSGL